MLTLFLISCYLLKVVSSEDGSQVGLPYLTGDPNSHYSTKFQRAFESIGTALSSQGSKDIDIKLNDQSYPRPEPQDVNQREVQTGKSYESHSDQNGSVQTNEENDSERIRQHFWSQLFVKHDNQKKNMGSTGDRQQEGIDYEMHSKIFDKFENKENNENNNENQVIQREGPNSPVPIEIPAETTPNALFLINSPTLMNGDKQWTINKQNDRQQQQYSDNSEDDRQEFDRHNGRDKAPEVHYYPQQPILAKPKLQTIEAKCTKEAIHVRVTYDRPFDGIIYAKDYYNDMSCHFVEHRSGELIFEFSLEVNRCGTTLIDEYSTKGETILENTLIFQNEPVFQEIWDSIRHLRCAWSGVFDKTVQTSVNVDILDSQTITYRGDSVESVMDVQYGHTLNAAPVQGFVRIGDDLTLSVSLIGAEANDFDVRVKDCIAHDGDVRNSVQLTDDSGCVLKKKLLGRWQKQRSVGDSTVTTFTYMQAFRFPEKMEVYFECNIEICKYECKHFCPEYEDIMIRSQTQDINEDKVKSRAKRMIEKSGNDSRVEPIRLLRGIRVIVPNDVDFIGAQNLSSISKNHLMLGKTESVCLPISNFVITLCIIFITLIILSLISAILCLKSFERRDINKKSTHFFR